jgi:hypothetical protein
MAEKKQDGNAPDGKYGASAYIAGFWPGPDSNRANTAIELKGWVRPNVALSAELYDPNGNVCATPQVMPTGAHRFKINLSPLTVVGNYHLVVYENSTGSLKAVAGCAFYVHASPPVV